MIFTVIMHMISVYFIRDNYEVRITLLWNYLSFTASRNV